MSKYICQRCFYETDRKNSLLKHLTKAKECISKNYNKIERSVLIKELDKIKENSIVYNCKYCDKKFINKSTRSMHYRKCNINNNLSNNNLSDNNLSNTSLSINNLSNIELINKQIELKKIELELKKLDLLKNDLNTSNNIINNTNNTITNNTNNTNSNNNNIINSNINSNNIINTNINNNINNQYNIKNYLANNPNILPFTRYDVSILYKNNGYELKELIENDKKYSKNNSDFVNNFLKKLCFNEQIQSNLNMYYDENINKIIIKLADGITKKYKVDEVINDIMNQMKEVLRKINDESYEIKNINESEYNYIDSKRINYNTQNNFNYTFILELVKNNKEKINNIPLIFNEQNRKNKILIENKTELRRPVDLRMDGPIDFNDTTRFVEYVYRNKKFYWDNPNDTLYEFRTKKFIGQRKSYVNRLNGYDTDGEPLPEEELINN